MSSNILKLSRLRHYQILIPGYNVPSHLNINLIKYHSKVKPKTAGIIVIGDEVLRGDVQDTNSYLAMNLLHNLGVTVKKVSIIGDNIEDIAIEVQVFARKYDYVLTSGGIGPTHDDVTFEAVAKAFGVKVTPHPYLVKLCSKYFKSTDLKSPGMKIAFIPETAKLTFAKGEEAGKGTNYPNVSVENVYIFPGIPEFFKKSLDLYGVQLFQTNSKFYGRSIFLNVKEQMVIEALGKVVSKYPFVKFGSYPNLHNKDYKVKLTVQSNDSSLTSEATNDLVKQFARTDIVKVIGS